MKQYGSVIFTAGSRLQAQLLSSWIFQVLPPGRRPRLALPHSPAFLSTLRCEMCLQHTGTLAGAPQPNWCQLLLAAAILFVSKLFFTVLFFTVLKGWNLEKLKKSNLQ
ncbi:hypothetical protein [Adhaeribacter radiodurans]|uniref:Uncharacterized protein n=1 Tax=Adhaeribacter radiodurans TaxID=2745197 RepID=A0A7L7L6L2_9BACT|nr:hypothetical protein [Adhaeribacter radiodurans]QMU28476.1 hypothetical protein HUW48_10690 [Adhaeribacter radiodurans]